MKSYSYGKKFQLAKKFIQYFDVNNYILECKLHYVYELGHYTLNSAWSSKSVEISNKITKLGSQPRLVGFALVKSRAFVFMRPGC
jgi:hypothetical protein